MSARSGDGALMMEPAGIDYKVLGFWFSVAQWMFNALVAAYLWVSRKNKAVNSRVDELSCRVDETEKTVIRVSSDIAHLPSHHELESLRREITKLTGELSEARGKLTVIDKTFTLINEFLINEGSKNG